MIRGTRRKFSRIRVPVVLALLAALQSSCNAPAQYEPLLGTLVGYANAINGARYGEPGFGGIKVEVEGTTLRTYTDSLGRWRLDGVPTGMLTIAYSKPDHGTIKQPQVKFVGGGVIRLNPVSLAPLLTCPALLDSIEVASSLQVWISAHSTCGVSPYNGIFFALSNSSTFHINDPGVFTLQFQTEENEVRARIRRKDLISVMDVGDSIFVNAYHANALAFYYDTVLQKNIYTGVYPEPSRTLSFRFP